MSSFKNKGFDSKEDASVILGEVHGFVDERALHGQGMKPEEIKELKDALDTWCREKFGVVPMELLMKRAN